MEFITLDEAAHLNIGNHEELIIILQCRIRYSSSRSKNFVELLKSKAAIQHAASPGLKEFPPEAVEREAEPCVVDAKIRRSAVYTIPALGVIPQLC
jgi:hypothetical protein